MILGLADFLIFLAITFVGDHFLAGVVPSFFLVWGALLTYRAITELSINREEVTLQAAMMLLLSPFMYQGIWLGDPYYLAFAYAPLYINAIPVLLRLIRNPQLPMIVVGFYALMTPFVLLNWGINRWTSNEVFIFGPNIMYRIYAMTFFMLLVSGMIHRIETFRFWLLVVFVCSMICLISTGSRGAFLLGLVQLAIVTHYFREKAILKVFLYISFAAFIYLFITYWDLVSEILGRLIYFDLSNSSENARVNMVLTFIRYLDVESDLNILFGVANNSHYYLNWYPHNFIIESIVYHGLIFGVLIFALIAYSFLRASRVQDGKYLLILFVPIMLGSMLSGYYMDNFAIISLAFYCLLLFKRSYVGQTKEYSKVISC